MKLSTTASSLAIAVAFAPTVFAIPPPEFGFVDSGNHTELGVAFTSSGNTTVVSEGQLFGVNITQQQPSLALDPAAYQSVADYNGTYLILMLDPDAPTPGNATERFFLHWLAPNMTQSDTATAPLVGRALTNSTPNFVPFTEPSPPTTSSAHRYILYAFEQPDNFTIPEAFSSFSASNRSDFNLTTFISSASLSRPAAGEYFYVSHQDAVPGTFIAEAGGTYPGGNGDAIFVGNAAAAATTAAASSSSASATGSAASASSTAASGAIAASGARPGLGISLGVGVLVLAAML